MAKPWHRTGRFDIADKSGEDGLESWVGVERGCVAGVGATRGRGGVAEM